MFNLLVYETGEVEIVDSNDLNRTMHSFEFGSTYHLPRTSNINKHAFSRKARSIAL